jgi:hypothetical protein
MKRSLLAVLLFGASVQIAAAADLGREVVAGPAAAEVIVSERPLIVPHCLEMPEGFLGHPALLRCAPRGYFRPTSVESLNLHKALGRPPRPYPEIYRE